MSKIDDVSVYPTQFAPPHDDEKAITLATDWSIEEERKAKRK